MKRLALGIMSLLLIVSCAAAPQSGPNAHHGFRSALKGLTHLVLSPIQIASGLLEGISSMPYYLSTNIHEINKGMIQAQAKVTLDDTYDWAYGRRLNQVADDGNTGEVFRRMKHATRYFQKVLRGYGVHNADEYILTSIDTANSEGYTLFAVIHRPAEAIHVPDKYNPSYTRHFSRVDRLYYEPFSSDIQGRPLDTVVDWAGLPREYIKTQKAQAILITIAANSVLNEKKSPDYWDIENRWLNGEYRTITDEKLSEVGARLHV